MNALKDKKFWIIAGVTAVIVAVLVYFARKSKNKALNESSTTPSTSTSKTVLPAADIFPLKSGSKGEEVKTVQRYLNSQKPLSSSTATLPDLTIDGIWGPKTQDAVKYKLGINQIDYTFYTKIILGIK